MTATTATFCGVSAFDGRRFLRNSLRAAGRAAGMGLGSVAAIGVTGVAATLGAAWLFSAALSASPHGRTSSIGPGVFVHDNRAGARAGRVDVSLNRPMLALATPDRIGGDMAAENTSLSVAAVEDTPALTAPLPRPAPLPPSHLALAPKPAAEVPDRIPLPRAHPARQESAPQVAAVAPPPAPVQKPAPPPSAHSKAMALAGGDARTAVYDISARAVFLPNGEKLEAHSGLGDKMDDPRFIHVRMRGPTPPNVYNLALRERLFHGVQALRLKPVDEDKMFGRDGMLAHSYLLGPNGQSHGCVSFKDYDKFLNAYLDGQVDRLIVVTHLDDKSSIPMARVPRKGAGRYAAADVPDPAKGRAW